MTSHLRTVFVFFFALFLSMSVYADVDANNTAVGNEPLNVDVVEEAVINNGEDQIAAAMHAEVDPSTLPHDLSPVGMFLAADWVVKTVMLGLLFASIVTWTIWLFKSLELRAALSDLKGPKQALASAATLADAMPTLLSAGRLYETLGAATEDELKHSLGLPVGGIKERLAMRLERLEAEEGRQLNRGTGVLATIGSTAPFVGLFGTVWGIMNSFIGISQAQTTNLSIVAPGIAEALLATACGLVAAIPAVMIYNVFARALAEYRGQLADVVSEIQRVCARDLDRGAGKTNSGVAA
ncbi:MAG: tonB-system energizer ExbB [Alcanivoracaceae bacterium]|nr:tonB-system energizer ExbB [Alcanivoracaceae bacterium]